MQRNNYQFTPGPWFVPFKSGTLYVESRIGGGMLQEVAACGPTEDPSQQAANAKLIAAAPDLLAAAELCREIFIRYGIDRIDGEEISDAALEILNSAINKAVTP